MLRKLSDSILEQPSELGMGSADQKSMPSSTTPGSDSFNGAMRKPHVKPNRPGGSWTEELVEKLKALWQIQSLSATQIGNRLGGLSRNAVLGKVFRLGLEPRGPRNDLTYNPRARNNDPHRPKFKFGACMAPRRKRRTARDTSSDYAAPSLSASCPAPLLIPLIETTACQCKFIPSHDGLCCGHPAFGKSSWCEFHFSRVFSTWASDRLMARGDDGRKRNLRGRRQLLREVAQ